MNSLTSQNKGTQQSPNTKPTLYYVHDPMCSWCWGFRNTWLKAQAALEQKVNIVYLVGGLAPDSDDPMPIKMQSAIQQHWRSIQKVIPGTEFNFDFWSTNQARRSTYPACRAVLAVKAIDESKEQPMITAIQKAYYLYAQNPSDIDTLAKAASSIGIPEALFLRTIRSDKIENSLQEDMQVARENGVNSYPNLTLKTHHNLVEIKLDYNDYKRIINQLESRIKIKNK